MVRKVARGILTNIGGFAIEELEDGGKALRYCEEKLPDLILLDWYMPVLSGMEFLTRLRALPGGDKPVVMFSARRKTIWAISSRP